MFYYGFSERVAIKIIEKSRVQEKMERMLSREVRSMEVLNHTNLIRLYEVMETGTKIYLISEWAPAGDLYSKVTLRGKLPEYDAKPIFTQILAALLYMVSSEELTLPVNKIFVC